MNDDITGMVRTGGHATSVAAARGVRRETLKSRVLRYAKEAGPGGFLDCELLALDRDRPESSFRKRRTELVDSGWIVDGGYGRDNDHGQLSTVWVHRSHHPNPPPLGAAPKPKKHSAADERAAIVAHIEKRTSGYLPNGEFVRLAKIIRDGIVRGDHLK